MGIGRDKEHRKRAACLGMAVVRAEARHQWQELQWQEPQAEVFDRIQGSLIRQVDSDTHRARQRRQNVAPRRASSASPLCAARTCTKSEVFAASHYLCHRKGHRTYTAEEGNRKASTDRIRLSASIRLGNGSIHWVYIRPLAR